MFNPISRTPGAGLVVAALLVLAPFHSAFRLVAPANAELAHLGREVDLAQRLYFAGRYQEALDRLNRVARAVRSQYGENHTAYAVLLKLTGMVLARLGRAGEAVPFLDRALAIFESARDLAEVASTLHYLAACYNDLARFDEAEPLIERSIALYERVRGPQHSDVAATLFNLAMLYHETGRDTEALAAARHALEIEEKIHGQNHSGVAQILAALGQINLHLGRYLEAEALTKRSLAIAEKVSGADHLSIANRLVNLANVYMVAGWPDDAEPLYARAVAIFQKVSQKPQDLAQALANLGFAQQQAQRYSQAEEAMRRSLAVLENALGPDHPDVAKVLTNQARVYNETRRFAEAVPILQRALAIRRKTFEATHPAIASTLSELAITYRELNRPADAEPLEQRALAIIRSTLGPDHPEVARHLDHLAQLSLLQDQLDQALRYSRQAVPLGIARILEDANAGSATGTNPPRYIFEGHLAVLARARRSGMLGPAVANEALEAAQWAGQSLAATALNQMASRAGAGTDARAKLVRTQQDAVSELRALDKFLLAELSKTSDQRNAARVDALRRKMAELGQQLAQLNVRIAAEFPDYAALVSPKPLKAEDVQQLLGLDEALVFLLAGDKESHAFALTREGFEWKTIALGAKDLSDKVASFRHGLEVDAVDRMYDKVEQAKADKLFDLALAHELYSALIGPVEALVKDKPHLMIVPSGALTALPFHLLVTEQPAAAVPEQMSGYRDAAWLIKRQAVTVLPSVASLKTLRGFTSKDQGNKPMIGFGDPVFDPKEPKTAAVQRTASLDGLFRILAGHRHRSRAAP